MSSKSKARKPPIFSRIEKIPFMRINQIARGGGAMRKLKAFNSLDRPLRAVISLTQFFPRARASARSMPCKSASCASVLTSHANRLVNARRQHDPPLDDPF